MINRRQLFGTGAFGVAGLLTFPRISFARTGGSRRLIFIIQRGAADGLSILAPIGDPGLRAQRAALVDEMGPATKLDALFALHPAMTNVAALYTSGEALFSHAVASANRDRSHFDAQNILETGGAAAYAEKSGWLNRLLTLLPPSEARALAIAQAVPMALRGSAAVDTYAPSSLPGASPDLMARVTSLYAGDPQLHALWESALKTEALTSDLAADNGKNAAATGALAAKLLLPTDGARVMTIESNGWDTHSGQKGRLAGQLGGLDTMIGAISRGLGAAWRDTLIIVATEFGRTVAANGTGGTDHGTASAAMLIGGSVNGGRVIADWPGLRGSDLFETRDLKPTTQLESLLAGAIADHYGLDPVRVAQTVYPALGIKRPVNGLIRA
ncbi:MAG: DUF1501 domain-containing protein [Sphingomonadaceae bacterium]